MNYYIKLSKYMSMLLRHRPEVAGLSMDDEGYVSLDSLVQACVGNGYNIDKSVILGMTTSTEKRRFELDASGNLIRAVQGHSVEVDLKYPSLTPPPYLYHGTAMRYIAAIVEFGLEKRKRMYVHLSTGIERAESVGRRRGEHALLRIRSLDMYLAGHQFFVTTNGDWLTEKVPVQYIEVL